MGKAEETICQRSAGTTRINLATDPDYKLVQQAQHVIGRWRAIANKSQATAQLLQNQAKANSLRSLTRNEKAQIELIDYAQKLKAIGIKYKKSDPNLSAKAKQLSSDARELIILCHTGHIEPIINAKYHLLRNETDEEAAKQVLRQEIWDGINKSIDTFDAEKGFSPLTHISTGWMNAKISEAIEREAGESGVRLKSVRTSISIKINKAANQLEAKGEPVTVEKIAKMINAKEKDVAFLLPWSHGRLLRIDATLNEDEGTTYGETIEDEQSDVTSKVELTEQTSRIRRAIQDIDSPLRRTIIEMSYGINREYVKQRDMFDGVYKDDKGNAYTAVKSIASQRKELGEKVSLKKQSELNKLFSEGKLGFEPGTPEARELAVVARGKRFDPEAAYEPLITKETGIPLTEGSVTENKRRAELELRNNARIQTLKDTPGQSIFSSEEARQKVREKLIAKGIKKEDLTEKTAFEKLAKNYHLVDSKGNIIS